MTGTKQTIKERARHSLQHQFKCYAGQPWNSINFDDFNKIIDVLDKAYHDHFIEMIDEEIDRVSKLNLQSDDCFMYKKVEALRTLKSKLTEGIK